jgi:hypothetical protein
MIPGASTAKNEEPLFNGLQESGFKPGVNQSPKNYRM